jgi:hypothetical protein
MKYSLVAAMVVASSSVAFAQPAPLPMPDWSAFEPLVGRWVADPSPDGAVGSFEFALDLQKRVLVRKNVADYPKTKVHHEDLMVVYKGETLTRADYWDNEGHVIHYTVTLSDGGKKFSFISDAQTGAPRFRLSYSLTSPTAVAIAFEIAPPSSPNDFKPYIKATAHKK